MRSAIATLLWLTAASFAASSERTFKASPNVVLQAALRAARSDLGATSIYRTSAAAIRFRLPLSAPASAPVKDPSPGKNDSAAPAKPIQVRITVSKGGVEKESVVSVTLEQADTMAGTAAPQRSECEERAYTDYIMGAIDHELGGAQPLPGLSEMLRHCADQEAR